MMAVFPVRSFTLAVKPREKLVTTAALVPEGLEKDSISSTIGNTPGTKPPKEFK